MSQQIFKCVIRLSITISLLMQVQAFLGFTENSSWIFYEPPTEKVNVRAAFDEVTEHYFTQRLDNFDARNSQTYLMVN